MIGLSPLTTGHPRLFQQTWVRSSSTCYRTFNLPMARSLGFGSNPCNSSALFRLAFAAPTPNGLSLLQRLTRWPIIQKVRGHRLSRTGDRCQVTEPFQRNSACEPSNRQLGPLWRHFSTHSRKSTAGTAPTRARRFCHLTPVNCHLLGRAGSHCL